MNYNKFPINKIETEGIASWKGYEDIIAEIKNAVSAKNTTKCILAVETYPGVRDDEILGAFKELNPTLVIDMRDALIDKQAFKEKIYPFITDDRVFGRMYYGTLSDFQVKEKLEEMRERVNRACGLVIVYGMGAAELLKPDLVVYADMARWEIQMRFRKGMPNYHTDNANEDNLKKFKQGYFFEWRIADKIKRNLYEEIDYYLDTNRNNDPAMITGEVFRKALVQIVNAPFRTVPYFDPGVWGGQWMKEVCGLDKNEKNFAWSFDGVPEENSILLDVNGVIVESPSINVVFYSPKALLGDHVYARFGAEFPIRFDFLDTIDGGNLSLQVHPVTDYIHNQFGMNYTQDESYYILDAKDDACVYLGVKEDADPKELISALRVAQDGGEPFDAEKFINCFPAKKHDHFLIPAGTIHCSGANCMVLEISATPYIFTMKLWDWGRVGLDGRPRPIHIDHGERVIDWSRRTEWVKDNLVGQMTPLFENKDYSAEKTGLHTLEFIETIRYNITKSCTINTNDSVNVLNLVEGTAAVVESPDGAFSPFEVHYAETFIIPAGLKNYTIRPMGKEKIKVICAYVR